MIKIIVTRHPALIAYLYEIGVVSETDTVSVYDHINHPSEVRNAHVIGVLPYFLAWQAKKLTEIPLKVPVTLRGVELTLDQIRLYADKPQTYRVERLHE